MGSSNETVFDTDMDNNLILEKLNASYPMHFDRITFVRDSGCLAYEVFSGSHRYFLRITKPTFSDTTAVSLDVHLYLQRQGFSVPPILFTKDGMPCIQIFTQEGKCCFILYEFIEGEEVSPVRDAEALGAFVGKLHQTMKTYPGKLPRRDRQYYIDRYIQIMRAKQYDKVDAFTAYGDALWERVKNLPYGHCHGDLYPGNILKTPEGQFYLLDFDTFCEGLTLYDPALLCNSTDYFNLETDGYEKTKKIYNRFLSEYTKYIPLSPGEADSLYDIIALYHFALQATIIEIFGINCVDNDFLDRQLHWLQEWKKQY